MKIRERGFTLIELLIVVLIIAILAAIAVPNFLEFQVRAKVARVASDFRTFATAMEAYFVDHNVYPPDHDNGSPGEVGNWSRWVNGNQVGFFYLTTPIAYVATIAQDPFINGNTSDSPYRAPWYVLASGSDNQLRGNRPVAPAYVLVSMGPDQTDSTGLCDYFPFGGSSDYYTFYDPTNGSVSAGDLYRFGGNYRQGDYLINGSAWETWGAFGPTIP